GKVLQGWTRTRQGQIEGGIRQMRQGLADWQATGAVSHRPYHLALLAEALGSEGRIEEGRTALAEALATATEERFWEAELHRLEGGLLFQLGGAESPVRWRPDSR